MMTRWNPLLKLVKKRNRKVKFRKACACEGKKSDQVMTDHHRLLDRHRRHGRCLLGEAAVAVEAGKLVSGSRTLQNMAVGMVESVEAEVSTPVSDVVVAAAAAAADDGAAAAAVAVAAAAAAAAADPVVNTLAYRFRCDQQIPHSLQ